MNLRVLVLVFAICAISCDDDDVRQQNPNLLNIQFDIVLNLNFPQYSQLNFAGNAIYVGGQGIGNDGIIVVNTGSGFVAWDASDPNEFPSDCTRLQIQGLSASSTCQNPNSYSLVTGQPLEDDLQFALLSYRVSESDDSIRVFN
jgi:nitrite reductase/ring-hydroxylating ferredoxin subunit